MTTSEATVICIRCLTFPSTGTCCSSHGKQLCHGCYRLTHFVQVCVAGCRDCVAEGLPVNLREATS